jgi:hypothetical protein
LADTVDIGKEGLLEALRGQNVVLLAGAGCSSSIGYPLWDQLIIELAAEFAPGLVRNTENEIEFAELIFKEILKTGRRDSYLTFLEERFEPSTGKEPCDDYHLALVQMGFAGLVTTNYDNVLESAFMMARVNGERCGFVQCDPIDLCAPRPARSFEFLRSLSAEGRPTNVLHLHGYFRNPENMIITSADYAGRYGEPLSISGTAEKAVLDSLHRRVIWALVAMHPILFVGFSLSDPFFNGVLRIVNRDFHLGNKRTHFAIMPSTEADDRERTARYLRENYNVVPVYYQAPRNDAGDSDHSNFRRLIMELSGATGVASVRSGITDLNRRMLEL